MKKPKTIISIIILAILAILVGLYLYLPIGEIDPETGERITVGDYFPFSDDRSSRDDLDQSDTGTTSPRDDTFDDDDSDDLDVSQSEDDENEAPVPTLRKLHSEPVAGIAAYNLSDNSNISTEQPSARFVERGTGHVYQAPLTRLGKQQISNTTIPYIYHAHWSADPRIVILERLEPEEARVQHWQAVLIENNDAQNSATPYQTSERFLSYPIDEFALAPDDTNIAYTRQRSQGSDLHIAPFTGSARTLTSSALTHWLIDWPGGNTLTLTTKPAAGADGYTYTINTQTGSRSELLGGISGLTVNQNSAGTYTLFSEGTATDLDLFVLDNTSGDITQLPIATLPEKCVWSNVNDSIVFCGAPNRQTSVPYPDAWYQGKVSFTDRIVRINAENGEQTTVHNLNKEEIDVIKPTLSAQEQFLLFINKKDHSAWSLRLRD